MVRSAHNMGSRNMGSQQYGVRTIWGQVFYYHMIIKTSAFPLLLRARQQVVMDMLDGVLAQRAR